MRRHDVREIRAVAELVRLLARKSASVEPGPVVGEPRDLAPARPRELEPQRLDRGMRLRLPVLGASAGGRARRAAGRRSSRTASFRPARVTRLSIPSSGEVVDRVVEDAEEEDEVERLELEQLPRFAEVAVDEPVRLRSSPTHGSWRCRSEAKSENTSSRGSSSRSIQREWMPYFGPDLEHPRAAEARDVERPPRAPPGRS